MDILEFFLLGVSLSMDAFAISISTGINSPGMKKSDILKVALCFGGFQALMPVLGWLLGSAFIDLIQAFDHWVVFGLLAFIGIKMIVDAIKNDPDKDAGDMLSIKVLLTMAVATSIDALAVGVSLAIVNASIPLAAAIIGATTFIICALGAAFGKKLGTAFEKKAIIAGGIVLIAIGTKTLIEHLLGG